MPFSFFPLRSRSRSALTLIELVVVIAILVVLGGILVQNMPNMLKRTHLAKCADTISALNRTWNQSLAASLKYPDVYDSLLAGGSSIDTQLTTGLQSQLTTGTLTTTDVAALKTVGVTRVIDHVTVSNGNVTVSAAPSGATARVLTASGNVAQLDLAAHLAAGNELNLKRHLVREADGSVTDNSANVRYLVFGLGPNCTAIGSGRKIQEAPIHFGADDSISAANVYQRYLIVMSLVTNPSNNRVEAFFEGAAGNDGVGPTSSESHVHQFYDTAKSEG